MTKLINEVGNKYGKLLVLERVPNEKRGKWRCQCDCGNIIDVLGKSLRSGNTKSCGCSRGEDLTGKVFNKLKVIERDISKPKNHGIYWLCLCECGEKTSVRADLLKNNKIKSCGCLKSPNLIGQKFGDLIVEETYFENDFKQWKCKCSCGNTIIVNTYNLKKQITTHCGCKKILSKGEEEIKRILKEKNISFIPQYKNPLCKNVNILSFDFCVFKDKEEFFLIEYQGSQHFKPNGYFGGEQKFLAQKNNDYIKEKFCKDNNINLYYITYKDNIKERMKQILTNEGVKVR